MRAETSSQLIHFKGRERGRVRASVSEPACVCVKRHLSAMLTGSQCQCRRGRRNRAVNGPFGRLLCYCRRGAQPDSCSAGLKLSHYHTDDPNLLVLNVLLLFWDCFSGHLLLRSKCFRLKIKETSIMSHFPTGYKSPLLRSAYNPHKLLSGVFKDVTINTILQGDMRRQNPSCKSESKAMENGDDMGLRT